MYPIKVLKKIYHRVNYQIILYKDHIVSKEIITKAPSPRLEY